MHWTITDEYLSVYIMTIFRPLHQMSSTHESHITNTLAQLDYYYYYYSISIIFIIIIIINIIIFKKSLLLLSIGANLHCTQTVDSNTYNHETFVSQTQRNVSRRITWTLWTWVEQIPEMTVAKKTRKSNKRPYRPIRHWCGSFHLWGKLIGSRWILPHQWRMWR